MPLQLGARRRHRSAEHLSRRPIGMQHLALTITQKNSITHGVQSTNEDLRVHDSSCGLACLNLRPSRSEVSFWFGQFWRVSLDRFTIRLLISQSAMKSSTKSVERLVDEACRAIGE